MWTGDYPYKAVKQQCKAVLSKGIAKNTDDFTVPKKNVAQMKAALNKQPLFASLDASQSVF